MTDSSNFVLRWEIDNATARFATGKVESEVFNEGGFKWIAAVERFDSVPHNMAHFTLHCDVDHNGPWKCEAEVGLSVQRVSGEWYRVVLKEGSNFDENNGVWLHKCILFWTSLESDMHNRLNDKVAVEFKINIISSERRLTIADPNAEAKFTAPNRMSNVILRIGEKRLHVYKEFLSFHSPVFETLFFGNYAENGKEEVEVEDIVYEEFLDLLQYLTLATKEITDRTALHLFKLADRFQIETVREQSLAHLTHSTGFSVVTKLLIADQYSIASLRDHCLNSLPDVHDLVGKACKVDMNTLTLSRYILETSLLYYELVSASESKIAAGAFLLALKMNDESSEWTSVMQKYAGYTAEEIEPWVWELNHMMHVRASGVGVNAKLNAAFEKYSHDIFFRSAELPLLADVHDPDRAISCPN